MKKIYNTLLSCALLGTGIATAHAETQYVTENLSTFLRRGAGEQFKIAGSIQAGESVNVLDRQGKYTLIRDNKNREAWILNSDLSSAPSSKEENPKLKAQVQELTLKLSRLDGDWQQRTVEMQRRTKQAEQQSADLLEQNSQLKRELEMTKNKNRDLEAMLDAGTAICARRRPVRRHRPGGGRRVSARAVPARVFCWRAGCVRFPRAR